MKHSSREGSADRLAQLLARCALKDQRAFAELYAASAPQLYGVALRILRRWEWAEEVLQDCYVSIWHHAAQYAPQRSAPLTWMTSIARNRALDRLRRPQIEAQAEDYDLALEAWQDEDPGPLERLAAAADARALARCLGELESRQRQSIALAFFHGLSHSQLAAHMKQPLGTVKTWVRRGLQRLRACLGAAS